MTITSSFTSHTRSYEQKIVCVYEVLQYHKKHLARRRISSQFSEWPGEIVEKIYIRSKNKSYSIWSSLIWESNVRRWIWTFKVCSLKIASFKVEKSKKISISYSATPTIQIWCKFLRGNSHRGKLRRQEEESNPLLT